MSKEIEHEAAEFVRMVKFIEPIYKSLRIKTLFADRGKGLSPVVSRILLLTSEQDAVESSIWECELLKVVEHTIPFESIDTLINSILNEGLEVDSKYIGFYENEEPNWYYSINLRGEGRLDFVSDSTTLWLTAYTNIKDSPHGHERPFIRAMKSNPTLPVSSISELTSRFLGDKYEDIGVKRVEIIAPTYLHIVSSNYRVDGISTTIRCNPLILSRLRFSTIYDLQDGQTRIIDRRIGTPSSRELPDGFIEVVKVLQAQDIAGESLGANVTVSIGGKSGIALDTCYCRNLPVMNQVWTILTQLHETKVGNYLTLDGFEEKLIELNNDKIFEALIASLLTSNGFNVAWTGGFGLSCEDMLVFIPNSNLILVCECTTGSPRHKIGLMKTAISTLSNHIDMYRFVGVVFTSKLTSDPERQGAVQDKVILLDATDIKILLQFASMIPDTERVLSWLNLL